MKYILLISFVMFTHVVNAAPFPEGWQLSTKDQYLKEDLEWYKGKIPNNINADFNGDKIVDHAWILTNKSKAKWALFVYLSSINGDPAIIKLDEYDLKSKIYMGITLVEPGKYKTACGKGYWDCGENEPPVFELNNAAIDYFKFESANSYFYWSETDSKFKRMWLSD